jgi:hypothetical protein
MPHPVTLEVVRNALIAYSNEMATVLVRTAYNMMIFEVHDYCTGIVDVEGNIISQNTGGLPIFLADLGGSEKLSKSGAADDFRSLVISSGGEEISRITWAEYYQHRQRLQESLNINVGLFALQRCIEKLISRDELRAQVSVVNCH